MNSRISVKALAVRRAITTAAAEAREDVVDGGPSILFLRQMSSLVDDLLEEIHGDEIETIKQTVLGMPEKKWTNLDSEWLDFLSSDYVRLKMSEWLIEQSKSRSLPVLQAWQYTVENNQIISESRG